MRAYLHDHIFPFHTGNHIAGLPGLTGWLRQNKKASDDYDGGKLAAELKDIKMSFEG